MPHLQAKLTDLPGAPTPIAASAPAILPATATAPVGPRRSLRKDAVRAAMWTLGGFGASSGLRLASHLVLAWLLAPEVFGLMALVGVFERGLQMFSDLGIGPSIINHARGKDPVFLGTAWTIQIVRGFALWILTCALAVPYAWVYARHDPAAWQIAQLLPVTAITAVIAGFNSTALFTLPKDLRFARVTLIELITQTASLAVMISWALVHPTPWAMVAGAFASAITKLVISHRLVGGPRVRPRWDAVCRHELFKYGKWIFLSTVVTFLAGNLDRLFLGNVLTLAELGIYSIAIVFSRTALGVTARLGHSVMFPVFSKFKSEPERLVRVALEAREVVLWVGAAVCVAIGLASTLVFETLWDHRYHDAGVIAQWLAVSVWTEILLGSMDRIPLALGNSRALFFANIVRCLGMAAAVAGYLIAGLPGFVCGLAIGPLAAHLLLIRDVPVRRSEILRQSARFTIAGAGYAGMGVLVSGWIHSTLGRDAWVIAVLALGGVPLATAAWKVQSRIRGNGSPGRTQDSPRTSGESIMQST